MQTVQKVAQSARIAFEVGIVSMKPKQKDKAQPIKLQKQTKKQEGVLEIEEPK